MGTGCFQAFCNGSWHDVQPIPGAFIINLGDMLERYGGVVYAYVRGFLLLVQLPWWLHCRSVCNRGQVSSMSA